jgi:elongin-A
MPVPRLYEMAKTRLIQNISLLTDIGDIPYNFMAPILRRIESPDQLIELETNCPQILGETGDMWLRFIKRDVPDWDKKPHEPNDARNWSKVYKKLRREAEKVEEEQREKLKEQMQALQKNRAGNQTQIVDSRIAFDPRAGKTSGWGGSGGGSSRWGSGAPAKTGKAAFDKLKRGIFDTSRERPKAAQMPSHLLQQRKGAVKEAPARLLRMNESTATAPSRIVVSRGSTAGLAGRSNSSITAGRSTDPTARNNPTPPLPKPVIHTRRATSPPKFERASLPADQHFTAPPIGSQTAGASRAVPGPKRKREAPNLFMPRKKRP